MMATRFVILAAASIAVAAPAAAQRPGRVNLPDRQAPRPGSLRENAQNRQELQQQVRQRFWQLTRDRVGLNEDQMRRLTQVNQRFEKDRRGIVREERETRQALRQALLDSSNVDQRAIAGHLDRMLQLQRQRLDLLASEQKELAQFMSPAQRARYMALQEQMRQRVAQLHRPPPPAADSQP